VGFGARAGVGGRGPGAWHAPPLRVVVRIPPRPPERIYFQVGVCLHAAVGFGNRNPIMSGVRFPSYARLARRVRKKPVHDLSYPLTGDSELSADFGIVHPLRLHPLYVFCGEAREQNVRTTLGTDHRKVRCAVVAEIAIKVMHQARVVDSREFTAEDTCLSFLTLRHAAADALHYLRFSKQQLPEVRNSRPPAASHRFSNAIVLRELQSYVHTCSLLAEASPVKRH